MLAIACYPSTGPACNALQDRRGAYRSGAMQDAANGLPRILILGTSVNKDKKKGRAVVASVP
jgi:hypothetical protein